MIVTRVAARGLGAPVGLELFQSRGRVPNAPLDAGFVECQPFQFLGMVEEGLGLVHGCVDLWIVG